MFLRCRVLFSVGCAKWFMLLLFMYSCALVQCSADDESLREQVTLLSKQMSALLNRRREDFNMMEDSMRKSLEKSTEMIAVKTELEQLRQELQDLREKNGGTPDYLHVKDEHKNKNDRLTVMWLSDALSELRSELQEVQRAHNASVTLQRREGLESELALLRIDVTNMNKELEGARTEQLKYEATLSQIMEEVTSLRDSERSAAVLCSKVKNQLKSAQMEWSYNWKMLMESNKNEAGKTNSGSEDQSTSSSAEDRRSRHQRTLRKHIFELERANKKILHSQKELEEKISNLEDKLSDTDKSKNYVKHGKRSVGVHNLENRLRIIENRVDKVERSVNSAQISNSNENIKLADDDKFNEISGIDLSTRIDKLESDQKQTALSMFNMSRQVSSFDRLHRSILELLENVENLENKVDKNVPDFRKEISKLEFNMAQTMSEVALMKEDQSNAMQSVKAMSVAMSAIRDKVDIDHETLEQLNITLSLLQESNNIQNSKLHDHILKTESSQLSESYTSPNTTVNVVQELEEVENEYHSIINKLPHDCSAVPGPSGLYLISPGAGEPVMVACNNGWTTVQRRRDGSVDFNRNWEDYAKGFGTPSGEFWIGNRILNRLTKDNCSSLRIDMIDIYGKSYHAEYNEFIVENTSNGFRLHISGYSGNSSDALDYQNRMEFSTIDSDRDISNTHCASNYEGGWWFSHCQHANLNGRYNLGLTWFDSARNEWIAVATSEMKIRRRDECDRIH